MKAFVTSLKRNDEEPNKRSSWENRGKVVPRHLLKVKSAGLDEALKIGGKERRMESKIAPMSLAQVKGRLQKIIE